MILGTAAYMAPEQAKGRSVDRRADVWAFGVVLYEMVTGLRLFPGETPTEILASVLKEEPRWDRVPPQVQRLLRRCLEKDPERRLRHIGDAMDLVDETPIPAGGSIPAAGRRRRLGVVAAGVVFALGAIAAVVFWPVSRVPPGDPPLTRFQMPLPGNQTGTLTLSPNGRWLAYYGLTTDSGISLLVREMSGTEWRLLATVDNIAGGTGSIWSPDSRFIAFPAGGQLKRVSIAGGAGGTDLRLEGSLLRRRVE